MTLNAVTQFLHKTLWLTMFYQTKFGCKWTSRLGDIVQIVSFIHFYISPHCDLDIEDSDSIFLHDTPPHDNTPLYPVSLKMIEHFRRYHLDNL